MADKKTETCSYLSSYGGGYIRADQWVTEKLCSVIAKKSGSELPDKFWSLPKWDKIFRRQVQIAASLLILHDAEVIYASLKDKRLRNIRSFAAFSSVKFFSSVLEEHQNKLNVENSSKEIALEPKSTTEIPKQTEQDNKLSRLKKIDGETRPIQSG